MRLKYFRKQQEVDVSEELPRGRATFINFKTKKFNLPLEVEFMMDSQDSELRSN